MIKLYIENKTNFHFKYKKLFKKITKQLLSYLNINDLTEINMIILNNNEIQKISKKYRNKNNPTDILTFSHDFEDLKKIIGYNMLGDIFISYEKIEEQAIEYNHSLKRE